MPEELPVENQYLPADKQDAGEVPEAEVEVPVEASPPPAMRVVVPVVPAPMTKINFGQENFSPPPVIRETARVRGEMNFFEALQKVQAGAKITRISWNDKECYGVMHDAFLYLKEQRTGKFNIWGISEGDMLGTDWVVIL